MLLSHPGLSYTGPAQRTNRVSWWQVGGGGIDAVCSAERQATYGAARCGGRQAVTGDDAICQIGSLGNGAIEGPTTPIRHCHRRPTCLAHGWTCAAHVGDRAQTGPCTERTHPLSVFWSGLGEARRILLSERGLRAYGAIRSAVGKMQTRLLQSARRLEARATRWVRHNDAPY